MLKRWLFPTFVTERKIFAALLTSTLALIFPVASAGQLVLGQYEDEAPLRTWNIFGFQAGASLGRGETSFAVPATDPAAALNNPALLADISGLRLMLNGMAMSTSLRKFSIINTGVLATEKNIFLNHYGVDMAGISFSRSGWAIVFNVYLAEIYDRPPTGYEYFYRGQLYYEIKFNQDGLLRIYHFSLAKKIGLGGRARVGVGCNFARGELRREIEEEWAANGIVIRDSKRQEFSGFFINGGVAVRLTEKLDAAVVLRTPYRKNSPGKSELVYDAPAGGVDISIAASATSHYEQPLVVGVGASYLVSPRFRVSADVSFFNWASYRVEYFEEEAERHFRNTIKVGVGGELAVPLRFFGREGAIPLRFGLVWDEQPMKNPHSAYTLFSAGVGVHFGAIRLDLGASTGREKGSGDLLEARRMAFSLTLGF